MKAYLILEDGTVYTGTSIGANKTVVSEIVFNTSMTGYLEVLTDPSYSGQAVVMTYPLIGNYGVSRADMESERAWPDGFIVHELSRLPSNFRSEESLQSFLKQMDIPGIAGIDTRSLTIRLREKGTMNGMITTDESRLADAAEEIAAYRTGDEVGKTTCKEAYTVEPIRSDGGIPNRPVSNAGDGLKVALLDLGKKKDIELNLARRGITVTVFPAGTPAETIINGGFDGIMLSNGPGDPKDCGPVIGEVKKLCDSGIPLFAICLGHQLTALAHGADTHKLKYGHRGGNHPVRDLMGDGRVYITSQNHGYVVDTDTVDKSVAVPAFENVNDGTNEGLSYIGKDIFTVQFHPEACPGPQDTGFLFDRFIRMMRQPKYRAD